MTDFPRCQVPLTDQRDRPSWSLPSLKKKKTKKTRERRPRIIFIQRQRRERNAHLFSDAFFRPLFVYLSLDSAAMVDRVEHEKARLLFRLLALLRPVNTHVHQPLFCSREIGTSCSGQARRCGQSIASDLCISPFSPFFLSFLFWWLFGTESEEPLCLVEFEIPAPRCSRKLELLKSLGMRLPKARGCGAT